MSPRAWLSAAMLLGLLARPAAALETEAGATYERLTNDEPDWKSLYLEAAHAFAPRQTLYGTLRETERFDLRDRELSAGYAHPFGTAWTAVLEASHSPEHNVLPDKSFFGQLYWAAGGGWVLNGGARFSEYTDTDTRILTAGVERYFSSYRASYTFYNGKPEDTGSASSHRLAFDHYYYGERSRVGMAVSWGREVENVGPPSGIVTSDVRALSVVGRHWLTPEWAVAWELGTHEQGDFYRRTGGRLALRYRF
ncbi:MAG TPA: YaiO family outer membrane beta-barrel protein [Burkholderiales bacterium]